MKTSAKNYDVIIIGAGISGVSAAIALADKGKKVLLLDRLDEILRASSNATPGRMGLGFHYAHPETAIMYLEATIAFKRQYTNEFESYWRDNNRAYAAKCQEYKRDHSGKAAPYDPMCVGGMEKPDHPLRRGRYFITKDSQTPREKILDTYEKIRDRYEQLCKEDPLNKVFGEPDNLFRILSEDEYRNDVNLEKVDRGVETAEHLLDWPKFSMFLRDKVKSHPKITTKCGTEVTGIRQIPVIEHDSPSRDFHLDKNNVTVDQQYLISAGSVSFLTPSVINATWEAIDKINTMAGLHDSTLRHISKRQKVIVELSLPSNRSAVPSMFFCMGPHCMLSNYGVQEGAQHNRAMAFASFAPQTNRICYTGLSNPNVLTHEQLREHLSNLTEEVTDSSPQHEENLPINPLRGVKDGLLKYLKGMEDAQVVDFRIGYVLSEGDFVLNDPNSEHNKRDYSGIDDINYPEGWIAAASMKLFRGWSNAQLCLSAVKYQRSEYLSCLNDFVLTALQYARRLESPINERDMSQKDDDLESNFNQYKSKSQQDLSAPTNAEPDTKVWKSMGQRRGKRAAQMPRTLRLVWDKLTRPHFSPIISIKSSQRPRTDNNIDTVSNPIGLTPHDSNVRSRTPTPKAMTAGKLFSVSNSNEDDSGARNNELDNVDAANTDNKLNGNIEAKSISEAENRQRCNKDVSETRKLMALSSHVLANFSTGCVTREKHTAGCFQVETKANRFVIDPSVRLTLCVSQPIDRELINNPKQIYLYCTSQAKKNTANSEHVITLTWRFAVSLDGEKIVYGKINAPLLQKHLTDRYGNDRKYTLELELDKNLKSLLIRNVTEAARAYPRLSKHESLLFFRKSILAKDKVSDNISHYSGVVDELSKDGENSLMQSETASEDNKLERAKAVKLAELDNLLSSLEKLKRGKGELNSTQLKQFAGQLSKIQFEISEITKVSDVIAVATNDGKSEKSMRHLCGTYQRLITEVGKAKRLLSSLTYLEKYKSDTIERIEREILIPARIHQRKESSVIIKDNPELLQWKEALASIQREIFATAANNISVHPMHVIDSTDTVEELLIEAHRTIRFVNSLAKSSLLSVIRPLTKSNSETSLSCNVDINSSGESSASWSSRSYSSSSC